jgi:hypothetical protein
VYREGDRIVTNIFPSISLSMSQVMASIWNRYGGQLYFLAQNAVIAFII